MRTSGRAPQAPPRRNPWTPSARRLNERLGAERLRRGRGIGRAADRILWSAPFAALPDGAVVVGAGGGCRLVAGDRLLEFSFEGWGAPSPRPSRGHATVLTPPTSVAALAHGYRPGLHPSARR